MPRYLIYITLLFLSCNTSVKYPPGGYDYPEAVTGRDTNFFYLPTAPRLTHNILFIQSFDYSFYRDLDEPNLSLRPSVEDIFRLTWWGYSDTKVIVTLRAKNIIVKTAHAAHDLPYDSSSIDSTEVYLLKFLEHYYRYYDTEPANAMWPQWRSRLQHQLDSLRPLYPALSEPFEYYKHLYTKILPKKHPYYFYYTRTIPISNKEWRQLVDSINASGYWQLSPFQSLTCSVTAATTFTLEAATASRYNAVSRYDCPEDTTRYVRACTQLIHRAGLDSLVQLTWHSVPH